MKLTWDIIGKEEVAAGFADRKAAMVGNVQRTIMAQTTLLEAYIKTSKLHGQALNQRTGRLAASVHSAFFQESEASFYGTVGTNVVYAAIHEFGGTIHHPGGTAFIIDKLTGRASWISNADPLAATLARTKPHDIHMPERSYLRSGLADKRNSINAAIRGAVTAGAQGESV